MSAKPTISEILQARRFIASKEPRPETVILRIGGKKVGTLQNLVTFTGKQKNGKSRYISAAIAAGITGAEVFNIELRTPHNRPRIALFDTEQGEYDFYRQVHQIRDFCGIAQLPAHFDAYNTREDDPIIILQMVEYYLSQNPDCATVFVDGILDLLIDFNNVVESKRLTNFFKKITKQYNCLLVGVIHRGKGNDTTVGNIGSMADRLAQAVLKVEKIKDRGTFQLTADFMRSDADFDPIEIWNNSGHWEQCQFIDTSETPIKNLKARPNEFEYQEHFEMMPQLFQSKPILSFDELLQQIKECYGVGRQWAMDCVKHLRAENLVFRTDEGFTRDNQAKLYIDSRVKFKG